MRRPRRLTPEQWEDLKQSWKEFLEEEQIHQQLAEQANETGDYREYDEHSYDMYEVGTELAHRFAEALGMEASMQDLDGDADGD